MRGCEQARRHTHVHQTGNVALARRIDHEVVVDTEEVGAEVALRIMRQPQQQAALHTPLTCRS